MLGAGRAVLSAEPPPEYYRPGGPPAQNLTLPPPAPPAARRAPGSVSDRRTANSGRRHSQRAGSRRPAGRNRW